MYHFLNRTILLLELKSLIYSDIKKNRIVKEKHDINLLSSCQIDSLSFYCPVQLNKMNRFKRIFVTGESYQILCDKKLEVNSELRQYSPKIKMEFSMKLLHQQYRLLC